MQREERKETRGLVGRPPIAGGAYQSASIQPSVGFEFLRYGTKISLQNLRSEKYVAANPERGEATADGCHPGIYVRRLTVGEGPAFQAERRIGDKELPEQTEH